MQQVLSQILTFKITQKCNINRVYLQSASKPKQVTRRDKLTKQSNIQTNYKHNRPKKRDNKKRNYIKKKTMQHNRSIDPYNLKQRQCHIPCIAKLF